MPSGARRAAAASLTAMGLQAHPPLPLGSPRCFRSERRCSVRPAVRNSRGSPFMRTGKPLLRPVNETRAALSGPVNVSGTAPLQRTVTKTGAALLVLVSRTRSKRWTRFLRHCYSEHAACSRCSVMRCTVRETRALKQTSLCGTEGLRSYVVA